VAKVDGQWVVTVAPAEAEAGVPESLRQMIEQQLDGCSPEEQRLLAASVEGAEFSAAAVGAGVPTAAAEVEERCAVLARRGQFVQARGVEDWPDGTISGRYGFLHALYQQVVYDRLPPGLRMQLHRRVGEREEAAYGMRAAEQAAKLAMHFDHEGDYSRAAPYRRQAAENALRRHAYHEAMGHLTRGLEVLKTLPATGENLQHALELQTLLGMVLTITKGFAAPEVAQTYVRARELCQQGGDTPHLFSALWGLWVYALVRTELHTARACGGADAPGQERARSRLPPQTGAQYSLALVLHFAAWVHRLRGEVASMREIVAELVALASQEGFAYWTAQAIM
jgi:predicted ATPase